MTRSEKTLSKMPVLAVWPDHAEDDIADLAARVAAGRGGKVAREVEVFREVANQVEYGERVDVHVGIMKVIIFSQKSRDGAGVNIQLSVLDTDSVVLLRKLCEALVSAGARYLDNTLERCEDVAAGRRVRACVDME